MTLDPAFHAALRGALGLLLLHAAAHKLRSPARFRAAFAGYRVVPDRLVSAAAALVVLSELVAGIGLLAPGAGAVPALLAAALLATYAAAIAINLARGRRDIDCGCAGPAAGRPLGAGLVVRNTGVSLAALAAALPAGARTLSWVDAGTVVAFVGAAALLYASADLALAMAPRLAALRGPR